MPSTDGIAESLAEDIAIDEFNDIVADKIGQKDPYNLKIPQGLSKRDADILKRCRRRAHQLDHNAVLCYCCPCFFGLNTAICILCKQVELMIGLIPVIGPMWANSLSGMVLKMAEEADIPATLQAQMAANIAFDFLISLPPFIGALFAWMHKCNTRNVALLDTYLRKRAKDNLAKGPAPQTDVITLDPSPRVDMRFADVQTQPQRVEQNCTILPTKGKVKKPKKGTIGEQEMGLVQLSTSGNGNIVDRS